MKELKTLPLSRDNINDLLFGNKLLVIDKNDENDCLYCDTVYNFCNLIGREGITVMESEKVFHYSHFAKIIEDTEEEIEKPTIIQNRLDIIE